MEAIFPTNNLLAQALLGSTRSPRRNPLRPVQGNTLQKAKDLGAIKAFQSPNKQVLLLLLLMLHTYYAFANDTPDWMTF
jgi:hypothetical protein